MLALDSEVTGLDHFHGARPYMVTLCDEVGSPYYYEFEVDPYTRRPQIPQEDIEEIRNKLTAIAGWNKYGEEIREKYVLVGQNSKFDCHALETIGITEWPWSMTRDTLIAGHLLASNQPHDLTSMVLSYLQVNIQPLEDALEDAVQACRRYCRSHFKGVTTMDMATGTVTESGAWAIAKEGRPDMPSAKGKTWKYDCWLPRALAIELGHSVPDPECEHEWQGDGRHGKVCSLCRGHNWFTVCSDYALVDAQSTMALWLAMAPMIRERQLWAIFLERMKSIPVAVEMERNGVTLSRSRLHELSDRYTTESDEAGARCVSIAARQGFELTMPKGAAPNDSLREFVFDYLKVEQIHVEKAKTDAPTLNKEAKAYYLATLPQGPALDFFQAFQFKGKRDTAIGYMAAYQRFWHPTDDLDTFLLHPELKPTGARTLRWSSERPNSQNVSKQEIECDRCNGDGCKSCDFTGKSFRSTRYCMGPAPGREWWSMDFKNVELRLPAYLSGETEMINLFERPDEPPYYGSNHLLNFHTIYPDVWEEAVREVGWENAGPYCKKEHASSWYVWCKNTGFAIQYGCQRDKADATAHRAGAFDAINARFTRIAALSRECIRQAERCGCVETIPDRSVDLRRGYPLMCTKTDRGSVLNTVPLSYKIQSSAMWITMKGMIRTQGQLTDWRLHDSFDGRIIIQVHDEMVFDFPKSLGDVREDLKREKLHGAKFMGKSNLWRARRMQQLMEMGGSVDFGIPTPVGVEYHETCWSEGMTC